MGKLAVNKDSIVERHQDTNAKNTNDIEDTETPEHSSNGFRDGNSRVDCFSTGHGDEFWSTDREGCDLESIPEPLGHLF